MTRGPLDPALIKAWNKGREAGKKEAIELFMKLVNDRMDTITEIKGIGEQRAWQIREHFIKGMEEQKFN